MRVLGHCIGAAIAVSLLGDDNPWWIMALWLVGLALAVTRVVQIEQHSMIFAMCIAGPIG